MDPPHFLLDALNDSITSGTFIDTKFYVFSRREASGCVSSPRALYCNSRVLNAVPYFSSLFSNAFLEGQMRGIDEEFPSDSHSYTEYYDYLSDSDLEDESSCSEGEYEETPEGYNPELSSSPGDLDSQVPPTSPLEHLPQVPPDVSEVQDDGKPGNGLPRMGKVAIIRDMAAVTFEAMLYFLYTGEIKFAPFSSDTRRELPAQARTGDWSESRLPSPSAKSIYRLADKYDMPTLKQEAEAYIYDNLAHCNIVDEVFSSFSFSFPEILSVQVSRLVSKMKEESEGDTESLIRKQLRDKIAALSQLQLPRAADALVMIWNGVVGPPDPLTPKPKPTLSVKPTLFPNWHRVKLALLKSIPTGTFIDVQLYAYNAIGENLPVDPRPLFTSTIVIERWGAAITTQTAGMDSQPACLVDGLVDDYERWYGELPEALQKCKTVLKYQTEVPAAETREVVMLMSGAWKTWLSFLSYAYTNEMTFAPLHTSMHESDPVMGVEVQQQRSCSPRSMYSLATALGIKNITEDALRDIQSKLSPSNIAQELFTSFAASHKTIMDMEVQFLHESFTEKNPKLLMGHIQKMASGEAPFFATTLGLIYDKLVEKAFTQPIPSGSDLGKSTEGHGVVIPDPPPQASTSISSTPLPFTSNDTPPSSLQAPAPEPAPEPVPLNTAAPLTWLRCSQCRRPARLEDLYDGLRCPVCPSIGDGKGRPFMQCPLCNVVQAGRRNDCIRVTCRTRFM